VFGIGTDTFAEYAVLPNCTGYESLTRRATSGIGQVRSV